MHANANTCYEFSFYECKNMLMLVMTFFSWYTCIYFFNIDYDVW